MSAREFCSYCKIGNIHVIPCQTPVLAGAKHGLTCNHNQEQENIQQVLSERKLEILYGVKTCLR